uniref:Uncharacterized protein n=1 Tax=Eutreptiella gymnastica TaxID=73025 RepID=A0A7S4GEF0_9EUGL
MPGFNWWRRVLTVFAQAVGGRPAMGVWLSGALRCSFCSRPPKPSGGQTAAHSASTHGTSGCGHSMRRQRPFGGQRKAPAPTCPRNEIRERKQRANGRRQSGAIDSEAAMTKGQRSAGKGRGQREKEQRVHRRIYGSSNWGSASMCGLHAWALSAVLRRKGQYTGVHCPTMLTGGGRLSFCGRGGHLSEGVQQVGYGMGGRIGTTDVGVDSAPMRR